MVSPEFLWSVLPQVLGVVIIAIAVWRGSSRSVQDLGSSTNATKSISCDRPNCVRCRRYANAMSGILKSEWREYIAGLPRSDVQKLDRLSLTIQSLSDAKSADFKPTFEMINLSTKPFHEPASFAEDVMAIESNYHDILREYQHVTGLDRGWIMNNTPTGQWRTFYLVNQGKRVTPNSNHCPITSGLVESMQNVMTNCIFGNVCFSVVNPGTHIAEHYGPCNIRVRCHLGLEVPLECAIMVDGEKRRWERGSCTLFDDSYLHSVTHAGSAEYGTPRAILLVDLWSPEVTLPERTALKKLLHSNQLTF